MKPTPLFLAILLFVMGGCLGQSSDADGAGSASIQEVTPVLPTDAGHETGLYPQAVPGTPGFHTIINQSADQHVTLREEYDVECLKGRQDDIMQVVVYSAEGLEYRQDHHVAYPRTHLEVQVDLSGPAPHFIGGSNSWCTQLSSLSGTFESWQIPYQGRMSVLTAKTVHIPVGSSNGEEVFEFPEAAWQFVIAGLQKTEGHKLGTVSLTDPDGNVSRETTFGMFGTDDRMNRFILLDGDYRIRVELEAVAIQPTAWTYSFQFLSLPPSLCHHGFRWETCPATS